MYKTRKWQLYHLRKWLCTMAISENLTESKGKTYKIRMFLFSSVLDSMPDFERGNDAESNTKMQFHNAVYN